MNLQYFKDRRILLTGHTGFKGSWMTEMLLEAGAIVSGCALEPPTDPSLFDVLGLGERLGTHHHICDVRDLHALMEVFQEEQPELKKMEATAYYDSYGHGYGADGSKLIEGLTLAARPCDLGKTFIVYNEDYRLIGIYECRDTGYGQSTHYGQSRILPGRSVGTIEAGQCIDIYFKTYAQCKAFGRQTVYVQIIDAEG